MMSAFFHFQHTLNRLFNNCIKVLLKLDKFFFKCEGEGGGGGQTDTPPLEKLPSKTPALLGLKNFENITRCRGRPWSVAINFGVVSVNYSS